MQMTGEQLIAAPRDKVWAALNDPEVLRQSIPGCQSLTKEGADSFAAVAEIKIGPIGARFKGKVQLSDIDAPNGYTISGSGNGGIAGSAKGGAKVRLSDAPGGGTLVSYDVDVEVGGRMAQLGGPIIDATAKNLAGKFFARFGEVVSGGGSPVVETAAAAPTTTAAPVVARTPSTAPSGSIWGWVAALLTAILVGYYLGANSTSGGMVSLVLALLVLVAAAAFEAGKRGAGR
jgi:carbon monoxide dehydrogenase subunit G